MQIKRTIHGTQPVSTFFRGRYWGLLLLSISSKEAWQATRSTLLSSSWLPSVVSQACPAISRPSTTVPVPWLVFGEYRPVRRSLKRSINDLKMSSGNEVPKKLNAIIESSRELSSGIRGIGQACVAGLYTGARSAPVRAKAELWKFLSVRWGNAQLWPSRTRHLTRIWLGLKS